MIHTDFQKGFIKAEVVGYDDYLACGGEKGARAVGKLRIEGEGVHRARWGGRDALPLQRLMG